jgi:chromosome segregation protein
MTRLKALELFGFKSFADRTRFEFPEGITVVVGPNGSGKSNVVDAIKWVLGEQSVRSLRGKEMTDVIFAGSTSRKPLNYAEVSLVFDNTAGLLPLRTPEVQIMRRVQRSGESEYLVNGETARLRDIRELFSGTGAATAAYSVIEQGRVDALLVASGRERRAVFEEAAGIGRFRLRRTEALRRLERAELNRQRLADLAGELGTRLETVRQQAARARRWRQLTDRLRGLRLAAATQDLAEVDAAVAAIERERGLVRDTLAAAEARAVEAAAEAARLATAATELQPIAAAGRATVAATTREAAAAEAGLTMVRTRRGDLEQAVEAARLDLRRMLAAEHAARTAVAGADAAVTALTQELTDVDGRLAALERSVHGSHDEATDRKRRLAAAIATLDTTRERTLRLEAVRERAEERAEQARQAVAAAHAEYETARGQQVRLTEAQAACEGSVGSLETTLRQAAAHLATVEAGHRTALEELRTAWGALADRRAALEACRERTTVLREMVERHAGLSDAARQLLVGGADGVPGLLGPVADLLVAGEDWARLVDLALGPVSASLLVESLEAAVHWHAGRVATDAAGRVRLVAAPPSTAGTEDTSLDGRPGIVGRLDRLVAAAEASTGATADGHDRPAAERARTALLSQIWVVERTTDALALLAEAPPGTRFLARTGECLGADGSFELGTGAVGSGLVTQRSELRALERRQAICLEEAEAAQRTIDALQARVDDLRAATRDAQARRARAAETIAGARHELMRTIRERAAAADGVAAAEARLRVAEQRAAEETAGVRVAVEATTTGTIALETARAEVAAAEAAVRSLAQARDAIDDEIQELRIARATGGEKLARGQETRHGLTVAAQERAADVATARRAADKAARTLADHDLQVLAATAVHAEAVRELELTAASLATIDAEAAAIDARRRGVAEAIEAERIEASRLAEEAHRRDLEAGEARHRRTRIIERIRDEYDLDIESLATSAPDPRPVGAEATAAPDVVDVPEDRAALDREIDELRRKLGSYVSVNLDALHESEELAARLATLEGQLADVAQAKQAIEQLIERLDDESRRLLGDTIETVRIQFRELFERLFGGGQADIRLEEGVDLLETAVDIVARPPGKEPRSISLLSGGEKTMTCVALLLAIFKSRPSPFCVLDEVDAALDEANVDRFSGVLRDFLSATQFIVVTHSKKTMSAATTLYGVTMEESGVSKRVSVRFESAVAVARAA